MNAPFEIANALTVDVEDYFQVSALSPYISRGDWDSIPCRVERNVDAILSLFAEARVRATFFTLGWIAERENHHPDLELGWGRCQVRFSTHDVGGISLNDFICAAKTEALLTA